MLVNDLLAKYAYQFNTSEISCFFEKYNITLESGLFCISVSSSDPKKISFVPKDKLYKYYTANLYSPLEVRGKTYLEKDLSETIKVILQEKGNRIEDIDVKEFQIGDVKPCHYGRIVTTMSIWKFLAKYTNLTIESEIDQLAQNFVTDINYSGDGCKLVSGELIRKYYNEAYYFDNSGTLGDSCMKSYNCQKYFDIYCRNPQVQLAVYLVENKVAARALVWDNKYSDRVYYYNSDSEYALKAFLKKEGYTNIWHGHTDIKEKDNATVVKLDNVEFDYYPFMDSMFLLNFKDKVISNSLCINPDGVLGCTSGEITTADDDDYHISNSSRLRSYFNVFACSDDEDNYDDE